MAFWLDITDSSLVPLGSGPITTAPGVRITRRLDRAGDMRVSIPAVDPRAALIQAKRILRAYTQRGGVLVNAGDGIIDSITISANAADAPMLEISGDDLLGELGNRLVGALELSDGAGGPIALSTALTNIFAFAPAGWTLDTTTFTPTGATIYLKLQNETVLGALSKVASQLGEHFRLGVGRTLVWMGTAQPNSGIRAVMRGETLALRANPSVCVITALSEVADSHDAATRVYARGGGNETAAVTLQLATDTPPTGYSRGSDTLGYYLKHDASDTANRIDASVSFKDIAVLSSHSGAPAAASNQLQKAALTYLQGHLPTAPQKTYRLSVTGLSKAVQPGELISATYRKVVGSYIAVDINALVVALETTTELSSRGVETVGMVVSTVAAWPQSDGEVLSKAVDTVLSLDRHLQKVPQATTADTATGIAGTATANTVYSGPTTGSPAAATFRALVAADLPSISSGLSGILPPANGGTGTANTGNLAYPSGGGTADLTGSAQTISALKTYTGGVLINSAFRLRHVNVAGGATVAAGNVFVECTDTTVARTFTMPDAATVGSGGIYIIKDGSGGAAAHNITINPAAASGQTFDGAASVVINTNWGVARLESNGTNWRVW